MYYWLYFIIYIFSTLSCSCSLLVWLMYNKMLMLLLLFSLFFPGVRFLDSSHPSSHHANRSIIIILVVVLYICCIVVKKYYDDIVENNYVQYQRRLEFSSIPNVLETFHTNRRQSRRRQQTNSRIAARQNENTQENV